MNANSTLRITQLFDERRGALRQRLLAHPQAGQAEAVLRTFTDQLFLDYRQANPALTSKDGTQLNLIADSLKGGLQLMLTANKATFWQPVAPAGSIQLAPDVPVIWWTKLLRVLAVAALTAWLFTLYSSSSNTFERVLAGLALAVVLVAELMDWLLPTLRVRETRKAQMAQAASAMDNPRPQTRVEVELDVDTTLLRYRDVLALADRAVRTTTTALPAASSAESDVPDAVLDFLQELASAHTTTDARYAAVLAAKVAGLLVPYDIEVQTNFEGAAQKNFSLVRNVEDEKATRPQLIKPAFVSQGKLLRRGEVAVPISTLMERK